MPKEQKATGKKLTITEPGAAPKTKATKKAAKKADQKKPTMQERMAKLFVARPRSWTIGTSIPHKRDMTHFVSWPHYIRMQRQKKILIKRLKCPPTVNIFNHSLDKATAVSLFKFMDKMKPQEAAARKAARVEAAKKIEETRKMEDKKAAAAKREEIVKDLVEKRPACLRSGLNLVTDLILKNKAQLVVIASDVEPLELVIWLPALCRKKNIPFAIVKNKARLGQLVHQKTAAVLAIADVPKDLRSEFTELAAAIKPQFLDNHDLLRHWGEPKQGLKHQAREAKRLRHIARTEASKAKQQAKK